MEIHITHPEAIAELEYLMSRLDLPASEVVERVIVDGRLDAYRDAGAPNTSESVDGLEAHFCC
jgi:hypothetical protein